MIDYLIIGADAAGLSAAVQIKRKQPGANIKVINKGRYISYGACGIPYVLSGAIASPQNLIHFTPESFASQRGIPVETGREATDISPEEHAVIAKDVSTGRGERLIYGKLLIATGAAPNRLPFLDYSLPGIFNFHTIDDLERVLAFMDEKRPKNAAVIGAGNIGCELAEALVTRGLKVRFFEIRDNPVVTWPSNIQSAVLKKFEETGIAFHGGTSVESVEKSGDLFRLNTSSGSFDADMIFSVVGTRPATEFCGDKLQTLGNGALIVDRRGRSSAEDIYAAGDCASAWHTLLQRPAYFPLGSTANKMGRVAGINMSGDILDFPGIVGTQIFKFFDLSLAQTGLSLEQARKEGRSAEAFSARRSDMAAYYPGARPASVELVVDSDSGEILGATALCSGNAAQFIDTAAAAVFTGMTVRDLAWFDTAYAPPFAPVWNALISAALKGARL